MQLDRCRRRSCSVPMSDGRLKDYPYVLVRLVPSGTMLGFDRGAFSGGVKVSVQAARSIRGSVGLSASVAQPSTFLIVIWPDASSAQNSMAAVSAEGSTVWVLIRRLNSSCRRSTAFVVRADFHWLGGRRVKVNSLSPASSRLSATARPLSRHLRRNALRRSATSNRVRGVDHVGVVRRDLLVQSVRGMGEQIV